MAKKLMTLLIAVTMVACSSISIYASDTNDTGITTIENNATEDDSITADDIENPALADEKIEIDNKDDNEEDEETAKEIAKEKEAKKKAAQAKESKYKRGLAAYIRHINPNVSKTKSLSMAGHFISKADKTNLDPKVLMAIAQNESTFYTNATGAGGAYRGLMQTSNALANRYGYKATSLYKAEVSIEVGSRYLRAMKNRFGTYTKALSAYAYGSGTVSSGNYSTAIANKFLNTRRAITRYLDRNGYI